MSAESTQRSAGWYAGIVAFWLLAAWLATVGLSSLIPQIFGPRFNTARNGGSCAAELHDLTDDLLEHTSQWVKAHPPQNARDTLAAYFSEFDRRLMQAKPSCTERERAAFTELSRLRHGVAGLLDRFQREELPHIRKLQAFFGPGNPAQGSAPTP